MPAMPWIASMQGIMRMCCKVTDNQQQQCGATVSSSSWTDVYSTQRGQRVALLSSSAMCSPFALLWRTLASFPVVVQPLQSTTEPQLVSLQW